MTGPSRFALALRTDASLDRRDFMGVLGSSALALAPAFGASERTAARFKAGEGPNQPMGEAKGIFPGRVVWAHDPKAARWDGTPGGGVWYEDKNTDPAIAREMLRQTLRTLTGASSDAEAWDGLFKFYNETHGRGARGYRAGEKVVVKLNLNCSKRRDDPKQGLYNTPQVTMALLEQLVARAGVPESAIVVCDASRLASDTVFSVCHGAFPKIRFVDRDGGDGRLKAEPAKSVAVHFADAVTPESGRTFLPLCYAEADYLINAALLKGHSLAGVTLCAKNHFGSVFRENTGDKDVHKGWNPSHMHESITVTSRPMGTYNSLVELMGHRDLGGKTMLYLIDALYACPHQSVGPEKWQSPPFNGHWTASLFASQDPVAIDSVGVDFFAAEQTAKLVVGAVDNYLHEAALAHQPPSGARYAPNGDAKTLRSLGVHEHWNTAEKRQYSRNLGTGRGIELVKCA